MADELTTLTWQFSLAWRLAQFHLPKLTDAACLWEPAPGSWNVRLGADGQWRPDWAETEPDPVPPVSIGWITWHLIWWWSSLSGALRGEPPLSPSQTPWPGSAAATNERINALAADWNAMLTALTTPDLSRPLTFLWPEPRPVRIGIAWANCELMKNVAEIGYALHLYNHSLPPA